MQICPNCSYRNRAGVVFCENCGSSLIGDSPLSTKNFTDKSANVTPAQEEILKSVGTDIFKLGTILRIEIDGAEPILLKPKQETVFGRRDPATGSMPDVDLTPFAGYRMGVSRKHAVIRQNDDTNERLDLWDMGSSNGTFLNGTRLNANRPYRLRDGDEIRFGQMIMRVYFQHTPTEGLPTNPPASTSSPSPTQSNGTGPLQPPKP